MTQISDLQDPQLGLSPEIFNAYMRINVTTLHRWQKDLLSKPLVLNSSKNVVYSAPTSSGKSLVYELIVLQRMQETHLKAIIILPFISITRQVHQRFQELNLPLRIVSFYGNEPTILFDECDIAVCTIEKANSIVNKLIDDQKLNLISTVVVDELHLIGDANRGYILELLITKLLLSSPDVKIVGMSATIPEISVLASWLGAYSFETDFRPVRLVEYVKLENMILDKLGNVVETLDVDMKAASKLGDPDLLIPVVFQTFRDMNSVLIFCAKRIDCEKTAKHIARLLDNPIESLLDEGIMNSRQALIESLVDTETGLDPTLKYCILRGIAYHHSGIE
jgi:DNA polymerase theta